MYGKGGDDVLVDRSCNSVAGCGTGPGKGSVAYSVNMNLDLYK
jgi:hypothetical protein